MRKRTKVGIGIIVLFIIVFANLCYALELSQAEAVKSEIESLQKRFSGKELSREFIGEYAKVVNSAIMNQEGSEKLKDKDMREEAKALTKKISAMIMADKSTDDAINLFIDWYGVDIKKEGASAFGRIIKVMGLSLLAIILIIILFTTVMRRTSFGIWMRSKIGGAAVGDIKTPKFKESLKRMLEAIRNFRKKDPLRE